MTVKELLEKYRFRRSNNQDSSSFLFYRELTVWPAELRLEEWEA